MTIKHKIEAFDTFLHVHLDNCSINIIRTDEGVAVDVWEKKFEGAEPIATTYALTQKRSINQPTPTICLKSS